MADEKPFAPVKLFCGLIYAEEEAARRAQMVLAEAYSAIDLRSPVIPFTMTDYYNAEMGEPLYRLFVSFTGLIDPSGLAEVKLRTNRIEREFSLAGRRTVNLDPGYLSEANVVIATCKNYYHRVPMQHGIYAHIEYVFRGGGFSPLEWTYPDFQTPEYLEFFHRLRHRFREQRRECAG